MKRIGIDFATNYANGNYSEAKIIHKFGSNAAVGTSLEDVWETGGLYTWPQAAVALEAISNSANDTLAGSGAQKVIVEGLDINLNEVSATINMNGTSASTPTTQTFFRIHRAYVSQTGTYQSTSLTASQAGVITIRTASGGATHITLGQNAGTYFGQSQVSRYTIPAGYTGFLHTITASGAATKSIDAFAFIRTNSTTVSGAMTAKRLLWSKLGIDGSITYQPEVPHKLSEGTDIWMSAIVALSTASIETTMEIMIIKTNIIDQW